ncbi:hypothetical protein B0T17DRAFT_589876 [Bombardia bombarda]|uniref:Uncharacterized protein n=1 Tax=Bombardia bombarda TaxID=252184 RepID=A0AA39XAF4_9PEZI|nr:hypothetical protein B0T17DRAFT_589876 [Bombardia bombarda]
MHLLTPLVGTLLAAISARAEPESLPFYWATSIITETVWTICAVVETETIFEQSPILTVTSITFGDVTLSDITVQPASSPTSCYGLPIPTCSLEPVAFATTQPSVNTDATEPLFFYLDDNATSPEYIATLIDGSRCVLDISSDASAAGRVAIMMDGGESLVFDQTGMHHFVAGCEIVSSITIPDFLDQILAIAKVPTQPIIHEKRSKNFNRDITETSFTVVVQVDDIVAAQLQNPNVTFGPSLCTFISRRSDEGWDTLSWVCQHPGANSSEQACEDKFHSWLHPTPPTPSITSPINSGGDMFNYLPSFLGKVGKSLTNLIPGLSPALLKGISWLKTAHNAVLDVAEFGGDTLCEVLHAFDEYYLVLSDSGLTMPHTIGAYVTPPVPTISHILASRTTKITKEPPRVMQPTVTDFPSATETTFTPTDFLEFTTILSELGSGIDSVSEFGSILESVGAPVSEVQV